MGAHNTFARVAMQQAIEEMAKKNTNSELDKRLQS